MNMRTKCIFVIAIALCVLSSVGAAFAEPTLGIPDIDITFSGDNGSIPVANSVQILIVLTVLTLAPSILIMMTSFTRFVIVLGFIRRALSLQSTPPNQTLIGLALFMTLFVMAPVFGEVYEKAYVPFQDGEISVEETLERASDPFERFMLKQVRDKDLALFLEMSGTDSIESDADIPFQVLVPAFILSELKLSFEIGFMIFLPFIVIDLIVASTLMALGMMMLPPVMISLPIKILLFIMLDGWHLIIERLILSIR